MTVFTLAFGGPDAAWMYACSCCSVQLQGHWLSGYRQPMLKRLSSCKMQRVRIVASSVEVHCSRCRRQIQMGWQCALQLYESWRLLASSLHDWSRKILETNPSRPRPRPRPAKNGLEWSRDQDRGLEDYTTVKLAYAAGHEQESIYACEQGLSCHNFKLYLFCIDIVYSLRTFLMHLLLVLFPLPVPYHVQCPRSDTVLSFWTF